MHITKRSWLFIGFVLATIGVAMVNSFQSAPSTAQDAAAAQLGWLTDFQAAEGRAREEEKLTLINFTGSDWCPPCMRLRKEVFSQPEFAKYAKEKLVLLEADFPRRRQLSGAQQAANESLARKFGIEAFPTLVVLNPDGTEVGRLGYTPGGPAALIARIQRLRK
jgi:thioredoxin-related protein